MGVTVRECRTACRSIIRWRILWYPPFIYCLYNDCCLQVVIRIGTGLFCGNSIVFLFIGQTRPWFGVALLVDSFYLLSYPIVNKIHMEIHMCSYFL